jgi:hypothetical protein
VGVFSPSFPSGLVHREPRREDGGSSAIKNANIQHSAATRYNTGKTQMEEKGLSTPQFSWVASRKVNGEYVGNSTEKTFAVGRQDLRFCLGELRRLCRGRGI